MLLQKIPKNNLGTDFICSDIHGHYSLLEKYLSEASFNKDVDRLFCLGDIIDRGCESAQCLNYLKAPWFFAVQGNHERMLINAVEKESDVMRYQWYSWGGEWAEDLAWDELKKYALKLSLLPVAIELEIDANIRIALLHAELPAKCDWGYVESTLNSMSTSEIEANRLTSTILWGCGHPCIERQSNCIERVEGIDHVFHGHTIVNDFITVKNRTYTDLGSYKTGRIAVFNPNNFLHQHRSL